MAEQEEQDSKTEEPTPRRIEEFRKRGELAFSKDLMAFSGIMAGALSVVLLMTFGMEIFQELWMAVIRAMGRSLREGPRLDEELFGIIMITFAKIFSLPAAVGLLVGLATGFAQTRGNLSLEPLIPKPNKLNPFPKLKQMFLSVRTFVELAKSVFKIAILVWISWSMLGEKVSELVRMPHLPLEESLLSGLNVILRLFGSLSIAMLIFAAVDFAWQKYQMHKKMMMTRQELKDEHKDVEGDPMLRGARRQRMREMAAQRSQVRAAAEATVIVVNPTHVAIALRYDPLKEGAPRVLCKGVDQIAAEIRQVARDAGVPIIQRRSLARLMLKTVKVGQEIPDELFEAVASVLVLVMRQKRKRS